MQNILDNPNDIVLVPYAYLSDKKLQAVLPTLSANNLHYQLEKTMASNQHNVIVPSCHPTINPLDNLLYIAESQISLAQGLIENAPTQHADHHQYKTNWSVLIAAICFIGLLGFKTFAVTYYYDDAPSLLMPFSGPPYTYSFWNSGGLLGL